MTRTGLGFLALGLTISWFVSPVRADKIVLRGGAQIKGKVLPDPRRADRVNILTERGRTPLAYDKAKILQVIPEPGPLDEYLTRRDAAPASAQEQYDLGAWCEKNKLPDLAGLHFEAAVKADKMFAPAQKKLGHIWYADRWVTADELREAQGLVKHKGKWITPEEKEQREKDSANSAEQATWVRRLKLLREAIENGADDRRREAEAQLMAIREAIAVGALVKVFGDDSPAMRSLLARVLGQIPGTEASAALVSELVNESDADVRHAVLAELARREPPEVSKRLIRALRAETPEVVNRAAWALANMNAITSVPSLVGSLVQTKQRVVMPGDPGGAGGGGAGMGVSAVGTAPTGPASKSAHAPQGFYDVPSAVYMSATVGPGVAAYGMSAVPMVPYNNMLPDNLAALTGGPSVPAVGVPSGIPASGLSVGAGSGSGRGPVPRIITFQVQNAEVLAALVKLTGRDFGYDVAAWKAWMRTSFRPDPAPVRRVPQP